MRIAFILQNLQAKHRGHGHPFAAGKPAYAHHLIAAMMLAEQRYAAANHRLRLEQRMAADAAFEERLAEARRQASMLKTSLYATLLSEL